MSIFLQPITAIRVVLEAMVLDRQPELGVAEDAAAQPGPWEEALWLFLPFGLLLHAWLVFRLVRAGRVAIVWLPR